VNQAAGFERRPLLFFDVDGPLNPFAAKPTQRPDGYVTHRMTPQRWMQAQRERLSAEGRPLKRAKPLRVWLNPTHGPALLDLPVELVWATTWEQEANEWIGPVLGLPELPVVRWPEKSARPEQERGGLFWKTRTVADYAAERPFAWVDDQITMADRRWCATQHPAPTLLQTIHPARGLTADDFAAMGRWARLNQQVAPAEGGMP
jgi:hypothetical protein